MQSENKLEQNVVWKPLPGSQSLAISCPCNHILYEGTRGPGKCLLTTTPVLTDSGWKQAGDITFGDKLVGPDGVFTEILGIFPKGELAMYRIEFDEGQVIYADGEHRWTIKDGKNVRMGWMVRDTLWIMSRIRRTGVQTPRISAPVPGPQWTGLDPYMAGLLLGDGSLSGRLATLYTADKEIEDYAVASGWTLGDYGRAANQLWPARPMSQQWKMFLGTHKREHKRVPEALLVADPETRLSLLQGLLDSDGSIEERGAISFSNTSLHLMKGVQYLVRSLGGKATFAWQDRHDGIAHKNGLGGRYKMNINMPNGVVPFRLTRKASRVKTKDISLNRAIVDIQPAGRGEAVCFAVAHPSQQFVIDGFVVTHNTDCQLMFFRKYVGLGYGGYWKGVIFDRGYKNLDDLIGKSQRWFSKFGDGASFKASKSDYRWVWPTGEELLFRQVKKESDYWNYHGQEFPFIGWNELSKYPTPALYEAMMSCNRSSFIAAEHGPGLKEIPLVVFSTTNPYGAGHNWVKARFIDAAKPGEVIRVTTNVFDPRTQARRDVIKTQTRIFGSYKENRYLSAEYIVELESISDENKRRAWLWGDWDIVAGGALDDVWNEKKLILPRFSIPRSWRIDRSLDWGSTHPFSVGWWAEASSEPAIINGAKVQLEPGSIVRLHEWYGTKKLGSNQGLRMPATDVASGIVKIERQLAELGWIKTNVHPGPADTQIRASPHSDEKTIAEKMEEKGISWYDSDKSQGSRLNGLELLRDRMQASISGKGMGIYFMDHCIASKKLLPTLPRDEDNPDDVDSDAEDHLYDDVRYRVLHKSHAVEIEPLEF